MQPPAHDPGPPAGLFQRALAALRNLRIGRRVEPIRDRAGLVRFLNTRSSYVAQMTLYGYLRTRAGVRFAELFEDERFVESVNIAKWHVWLACLSDLSVYAGGMLRRNGDTTDEIVGALVQEAVEAILLETGIPADAGAEFPAHAGRLRARLALCDWTAQVDGEFCFAESPGALVYWAPIVDDLKTLDAEIVRNSMRFRWQEIRQQLRQGLDAAAVVASADHSARG